MRDRSTPCVRAERGERGDTTTEILPSLAATARELAVTLAVTLAIALAINLAVDLLKPPSPAAEGMIQINAAVPR